MPRTPDRSPGALEEDEEIRFTTPPGAAPSQDGAFTFDPTTGAFKFRDGFGVFDPRSGSGLSEAQHRALLQLIHFISEGPAEGFASGATRTVTGGVFPTEVLWKRADNTALVRRTIAWAGPLPTTDEWKIYDDDGTTVLATITDSFTYSGVFEVSRTRTIS